MRFRIIFWAAVAAPPIAILLLGIGFVAYWTVPVPPATVFGSPVVAYDREIGFVPYPNAITERIDRGAGGRDVSYHIFNDRRGARVTHPGDAVPARPDILFVGDSFTWGHGVENEQTFADRVPRLLGVAGANVAMGSYGTTQSVQTLRKNIDLAPRLVVYLFINDHLLRNGLPCARTYYPFCLDTSHVVEDRNGGLRIAPPWSDGVRRARLQTESERAWLDPVTWILHGLDVAYGRVLLAIGQNVQPDAAMQNRALEFLLGEMTQTARAHNAKILFAFLPSNDKMPQVLTDAAAKLSVPLLDLTEDYRAYQAVPGAPSLTLPGDNHPSVAGHAFIASKIAGFIARENLLK